MRNATKIIQTLSDSKNILTTPDFNKPRNKLRNREIVVIIVTCLTGTFLTIASIIFVLNLRKKVKNPYETDNVELEIDEQRF